MILSIVRDQANTDPAADELRGRLFLDGLLVGPIVERASMALPIGVYPVSIRGDAPGETISPALGRQVVWIEAGRGWTYIHVTSKARNLKGCVGVRTRAIEAWVLDEVSTELAKGRPVQAIVHELGRA